MDYDAVERDIRTWYKDHVAEHSIFKNDKGEEIESLLWHKPGTNCYRIRYLRIGRVLAVMGDLGEATYVWGSNAPLAFIAGCNVGYFIDKCEASPQGRSPRDWNSDEALKGLKEHFKEYNHDVMWYEVHHLEEPGDDKKITEEFDKHFWKTGFPLGSLGKVKDISWYASLDTDIMEELDTRESWTQWLNTNHYDDAEKYLGQDFWEFAYGLGDVYTIHSQAHLIGLKVAFENNPGLGE